MLTVPEGIMDDLIAHVVFDPATNTYKPGHNNDREEVETTFSLCQDPRWARDIPTAHYTWLRIYPDSGATICLGGSKHLWHMELSERNSVPSRKKLRTVRGFSLVCQVWLPVTFKIGKRTTKQTLYICRKVLVIYFSKAASIDIGILPPCFPKSMTSPTCDAVHLDTQHHKIDPPANKHKFSYTKPPPYLPTSENIQKLKKWLLD